MAYILADTKLLTVKQVADQGDRATFEIEPLSPGYGITVGNALRRILLSSIEGAALTTVRIEGATHEFTTIPGVHEDLVNLTINLKQVRVKLNGDEPVSLILSKKGPGKVTVADFKANQAVEFVEPNQVIATLDKGTSLNLEVEVSRGRGYLPTEARQDDKLPLGAIALDAIFSPVVRVNYDVENTRVGNLTNYDKIVMTIATDGTTSPLEALQTAAKIAVEHFSIVAGLETSAEEVEALQAEEAEEAKEIKAPRKRATKTDAKES